MSTPKAKAKKLDCNLYPEVDVEISELVGKIVKVRGEKTLARSMSIIPYANGYKILIHTFTVIKGAK